MTEREAVERIGAQIGYGRLMDLAEQVWGERLATEGRAGGQHTVGPCADFIVPCTHPVRDVNDPCGVCCGSGRVTRWVAENLARGAGGGEGSDG